MGDDKTIAKKTEQEIDDFWSLMKRRPLVGTVVLIFLVVSTAFAIHQKLAVGGLQSELDSKTEELEEVRRQRDLLDVRLAPFLAVAGRTFPDETSDEQLSLLLALTNEWRRQTAQAGELQPRHDGGRRGVMTARFGQGAMPLTRIEPAVLS